MVEEVVLGKGKILTLSTREVSWQHEECLLGSLKAWDGREGAKSWVHQVEGSADSGACTLGKLWRLSEGFEINEASSGSEGGPTKMLVMHAETTCLGCSLISENWEES